MQTALESMWDNDGECANDMLNAIWCSWDDDLMASLQMIKAWAGTAERFSPGASTGTGPLDGHAMYSVYPIMLSRSGMLPLAGLHAAQRACCPVRRQLAPQSL